jgi:hypothetical protein
MGERAGVNMQNSRLAVLVKGKDIVVHSGTEYSAYTDEGKDVIVSGQ